MKTYCNDGCGFSVLLNAIMQSFPSAHVTAFADAYPNLIREVFATFKYNTDCLCL
jgi:hypothetical protein